MTAKDIRDRLFELADRKYKEFHEKLIPNVNPDFVIGVRTPVLRKLAKEIYADVDIHLFLEELPHTYYEENNLHAFIIEYIKDFDECVSAVEEFLPYVDNWATCDMMSPKVFKKHLPKLFVKINEWIASDKVYTVRFGIGMLMKYFLDERFLPEYNEIPASVDSDEYYVKMMIAWYYATALAKQYDATIPYIENKRLSICIHNKAISKAVESRRITEEQKAYLKSLKIK